MMKKEKTKRQGRGLGGEEGWKKKYRYTSIGACICPDAQTADVEILHVLRELPTMMNMYIQEGQPYCKHTPVALCSLHIRHDKLI